MITIDSKVNKQIANNLTLEGMHVNKAQQKQLQQSKVYKKYRSIE